MLARCVGHVLALKQRPDILLVTGDLVDFGQPGGVDAEGRWRRCRCRTTSSPAITTSAAAARRIP
jgi:hypothetical protein